MSASGSLEDPIQVVVAACLDAEGRVLVDLRPADAKENPSRWEMPGGKVDRHLGDGDWPAHVMRWELERELREELGVPSIAGPVLTTIHGIPTDTEGRYYDVHLLWVRIAPEDIPKIQPLASQEVRWVTIEEARQLPGVPAYRAVVEAVALRPEGIPLPLFVRTDPEQGFCTYASRTDYWPPDGSGP